MRKEWHNSWCNYRNNWRNMLNGIDRSFVRISEQIYILHEYSVRNYQSKNIRKMILLKTIDTKEFPLYLRTSKPRFTYPLLSICQEFSGFMKSFLTNDSFYIPNVARINLQFDEKVIRDNDLMKNGKLVAAKKPTKQLKLWNGKNGKDKLKSNFSFFYFEG